MRGGVLWMLQRDVKKWKKKELGWFSGVGWVFLTISIFSLQEHWFDRF